MATQLQRAARLMGRKGGRVTAQRLSPEQRSANAKKAISIRWARYRSARSVNEPKDSI
jgi:hypothetical protein